MKVLDGKSICQVALVVDNLEETIQEYGVHHIAFMTDDRDRAVKYFEENGMPVRHYGEYEGGNYTVFDSAEKTGVYIQVKYEPEG